MKAILLLRYFSFAPSLLGMNSWERYKAMFENQPEWFFYLVTGIIIFGVSAGIYNIYKFSAYLFWGILAVILGVLGIYHLGELWGWGYHD